jgi:hypothetical protein
MDWPQAYPKHTVIAEYGSSFLETAWLVAGCTEKTTVNIDLLHWIYFSNFHLYRSVYKAHTWNVLSIGSCVEVYMLRVYSYMILFYEIVRQISAIFGVTGYRINDWGSVPVSVGIFLFIEKCTTVQGQGPLYNTCPTWELRMTASMELKISNSD